MICEVRELKARRDVMLNQMEHLHTASEKSLSEFWRDYSMINYKLECIELRKKVREGVPRFLLDRFHGV